MNKFLFGSCHLDRKKSCLKTTGIYIVLGLSWVFLSHGLQAGGAGAWIDLFFIALTSCALYFVLRYFTCRLEVREDEFLQMMEGVSSASGDEFFQTLVKNLSQTLDANYAFICEFCDEGQERVRTVAVCADGEIIDDIEFELETTPCGVVVEKGLRCYPKGLREQFPLDHLAAELEVESYVGIPLQDSSGRIMGPMAVFSRGPLQNTRLAQSMLQLFAARAAAELERRRAEKTIDYMASYDDQTGLPNRKMFGELLGRALTHASFHNELLAVMILDLDHFKKINDTLGHAKGDYLLGEIAKRLSGSLRQQDAIARLGGDAFLILFPDIGHAGDASRLATRLHQIMTPPFALDGIDLHLTSSIGIALYPHDGQDVETLVKNADTAMHRAKEQGRNTLQFYTPDMNAMSLVRLGLEGMLRKALERSEFLLHYQPQYDPQTTDILGVEALIRWNHPERGLVFPGEFISMAEETGLIVPIGQWVLEQACAQLGAWRKAGFDLPLVSVNLSARQFYGQNLVKAVSGALKKSGLEPQALELEITESILMEDVKGGVEKLVQLQELGVKIAIDDFGTGYSSLSYLRQFPIHTLKVDRSFVRDIGKSEDGNAIVSSIIALGHNLSLEVVAEGVETREQLDFLRVRRCDKVQGYLFSPPQPPERIEELLNSSMGARESGSDLSRVWA